jgi:hypothetical protein
MIEACVEPVCCRVTQRAIVGHAGGHVRGIIGSAEVCLVTRIAGRGRSGEHIVDVALGARNRNVCASERERRLRVVEIRIAPRCRVMAEDAVGREAGRRVIRILRAAVLGLMASVTISRKRCVVVVDVALCA